MTMNDLIPVDRREKSFLAGGLVIGLIVGALGVTMSKASRLADDVHEVKQDFDKAKGRLSEDYKVMTNKGKDVLENVDSKELGERTTEGAKDLGHQVKEDAKEVSKSLKEKLLRKLEERKKND